MPIFSGSRIAPGKNFNRRWLITVFVFLSLFAISFMDARFAAGVVVELRCNEGSGVTLADASGNGINGTLTNGPTWTTGKYGQGISLDGSNDYVSFADNTNFTLTPTVSYTWSGWVRNSNFNQWSTVWSQTLNNSNFFYFYAHTSSDGEAGPVTNGLSVYWYSGSNKLVLHSNNNVLTAGTWSYVTVTYNSAVAQASRFTIYVNGIDVTNRTDVVSTGTIASIDPTSIRVGANQPFGEYLNGAVDEIRYYRRLLSVSEIQADMNTGAIIDATAPVVSISSPAPGNVTGTINVNATASDNIGVSGVQFLLDGVNLGPEITAAPYTYSWNSNTVSTGAHTLTARARDAAGNTTVSSPVSINVTGDITPPSIAITSPTAGNVSGTVNLIASASDNAGVAGVQFLLDGANLGAEITAVPYNFSWNTISVTPGTHTLTARARDAAGNVATSAPVAVNVVNDTQAPAVSVDPPLINPVSGTILLTAAASDNIGVAGVQFLVDGVNLGTEDISAPYSISWSTSTVSNGNHVITARARDASGNSTLSAGVTFNVLNNGLVASFSFDENTGTVANDKSGNGNNGILANGPTWSSSGKFGAAISFDGSNDLVNVNDANSLDLTSGMTLEAWVNPANLTGYKTAICKENGTTNLSYALSPNNSASQASSQRPDSRIRIGNTTSTVTGTSKLTLNTWTHVASTFNGSVLRLYINGNLVSSTNVTGNISTSSGVLRIGGSSSLGQYFSGRIDEVRIYNRPLSQSEIQTDMNTPIAPDIVAPSVVITAPAAGTVSGNVNITANATDNIAVAGVQFFVNGTPVGAEDITSPFSTSWNTTGLPNGIYILTARARDASGNTTTSASVDVTLNNDTEPPVVIVLPPSGQNVFGTITLNATAEDNVGVAGVQFILDGVNLGAEDLTDPYSISWNTATVANGSHILTARARDLAGNTTTSSSTIVLVSNTVSAGGLLTALHFNEGTGTVAEDVSGHNHNGTLTGATWTTGKYGQSASFNGTSNYVSIADHADYTLDPTQNYTWSAWVRNNNFNQWSTVWSQTVDANNFFYFYAHTSSDIETGPITNGISVYWYNGTSKLVAHSTNNVLTASTWSHVTVTYNGSVSQANRFTIYVNGVNVTDVSDIVSAGAIGVLNPTNTRIGSNQPWGEYLNGAIDEVRYYNKLLTVSEIQADMNTPLGTDNTSPVTSITAPVNNSVVSGVVNITANATDNISVAGVQFLIDGANIGAEDITSPYSMTWNSTTVTNGNHTITCIARDAAGNVAASAPVNVVITNDTQAPAIAIIPPANQPVSGTIDLIASASDNMGVAGVQFLLDGVNLGAEDVAAPFSVSWNTLNTSNGTHTLTAVARDAAGNTTTSSAIVINVNNVPDTQSPDVAIDSPAPGNVSGVVNVSVVATDNIGVTGVRFLLDGAEIGSELLSPPFSLQWNTLLVPNGSHILVARARDAAGNSTRSLPVNVTVANDPDVKAPVVLLTSPTGGSVSGVINISATATDNVGVTGVQFLLDGGTLGAEDLAAPYTITWNAGLATPGTHTLSARARDAAGNTGVAEEVLITITISDPPVVSNVSVTSINAGSAVINWTTNIPANSQVIYGTTVAYGQATMIDQSLTTSHSLVLYGLAPGTLYHFQALSANTVGNSSNSGDRSFSTSNLGASLGSLNGHTVLTDAGGKIVSWTPNPIDGYHNVITLAWNYLLNTVPNDPRTGKPAYYSRSYIDPNTQAMVDWPHNPAGLYAMMIESGLKYYHYSGNANVMQVATNVALWQLDNGMTLATDNWPGVPYASSDAGSLTYAGAVYGNGNGQGDGVGYIQPDKVGELGKGWLDLFKYSGNTRFRDAAIQAANVLSSKIRVGNTTQSPWPYRVNAKTGAVREDYCSHIIAPISLLDGLIAAGLGDTAAYRNARNIAWNWMMTYPMQNNAWAQYFEDVPIQPSYNTNINQYNAMMTARYLLEHPEMDPNWEMHVRGLIAWVELKFAQASLGATTIKEQDPIFPYAMGSHTSRYASVNAMLYEKTGDLAAREKAYRSFNWATYMTKNNGVVIDGPNVDHEWFTDGYGDYIRHFIVGMASVPEWTPANQTHLLRTTSVVKSVAYTNSTVSYTTYDGTSTEVIHLNFTPVSVVADGIELPQRTDLSQPGWMVNPSTKTITIYHVGATQVKVSADPAPLIVKRGELGHSGVALK